MPKQSKTRGFVILIVLAVAAVITVLVSTQLLSGQKAQISGIRNTEEAQARAIAEACLDEFTAYAQGYGADAGPGSDFDGILLGPNHTSTFPASYDGDDFRPALSANTIQIPPGIADALHRWELVDVGVPGGLCAVRFDDNSDDARADLPGGSPATTDGTGTEGPDAGDDPVRDRDLSIYVSVIGLFPAKTGVATAYSDAHARVTLRRLVQRQNIQLPSAPAIYAGAVNLKNNNDICGSGGITVSGPTFQLNSNSCVCGATSSDVACTGPGCPTAGTTCTCPAGTCQPSTGTVIGAPPPPPANVHYGVINDRGALSMQNLLANEGWGRAPWVDPNLTAGGPFGEFYTVPAPGGGLASDPGCTGVPCTRPNNIGDFNFCSIYATFDGDVFLWDATDPDAYATLHDIFTTAGIGTSVRGITPIGAGGAGTVFDPASTGFFNSPVVDCTNNTQDPFPGPCTWNSNFYNNAAPPTLAGLTCSAGQSPCWKLVARVGDDNNNEDLAAGMSTTLENTSNEQGDGDGNWEPLKSGGSGTLPNIRKTYALGGGVFFGGANRACGDVNACSSCSSTQGTADLLSPNSRLFHHGDDHWHFKADTDNAHMPFPAYWITEGPAGSPHTAVEAAGSALTGPFRAAIFAQNKIDGLGGGNDAICCPKCDCHQVLPPTPAMTPGLCSLGGTIQPPGNPIVQAIYTQNKVDGTDSPVGNENVGTLGIALKSLNQIQLDGFVVGDVKAPFIKINSTSCNIGNLVAYGPATCGGACAPGDPGALRLGASVCFGGNAQHIGDIESMKDIDDGGNNPLIWGNVVAHGDVCFKNNAKIEGSIAALGEVVFQNNAEIVQGQNSRTGGTPSAANPALTSFMEATW